MSRTRCFVIAMIVCLCASTAARAQVPASDGWVVLPIDEYRELRTRANPDGPTPNAPPVEATLTRIDYDLRVDPSTSLGASDSISGRAQLTIDVLKLSLIVGPVYCVGLFIGARMFGVASETLFRRVCYSLIALAAIVSLPALDPLLRR